MAPSKKRSSRSSPGRLRSFFSHRNLLVSETVLVLGLVQMFARDWLLHDPHLPAWARVALGMGLVVGLFGWLFLFLDKRIKWGLKTTHDVVQKLPLPTPALGVHVLILCGLFYAYAWFWGLDRQLIPSIRETVELASELDEVVASEEP